MECVQLFPIQYDVGCGFVMNRSYYSEVCSFDAWSTEVFCVCFLEIESCSVAQAGVQ